MCSNYSECLSGQSLGLSFKFGHASEKKKKNTRVLKGLGEENSRKLTFHANYEPRNKASESKNIARTRTRTINVYGCFSDYSLWKPYVAIRRGSVEYYDFPPCASAFLGALVGLNGANSSRTNMLLLTFT